MGVSWLASGVGSGLLGGAGATAALFGRAGTSTRRIGSVVTAFRAMIGLGASALGHGATPPLGGSSLGFGSTAILIGPAHSFATRACTVRAALRGTTEFTTAVALRAVELGIAGTAIFRARTTAHVGSRWAALLASTSKGRALGTEVSATALVAITIAACFRATLRRTEVAAFVATARSLKAGALRGLRA